MLGGGEVGGRRGGAARMRGNEVKRTKRRVEGKVGTIIFLNGRAEYK